MPSLFPMWGHVDAVHGMYYLFLHAWIDMFGASELATRLPSALAIGLATAGTATLARMVVVRSGFGTRIAVIAALVFATLPRVTYMGAEARSTALATAIAVWLTVLLLHILQVSLGPDSTPRQRRRAWIGYAVLLAAGIYMFLYLVLLLPAHAVAVWLSGPHREDGLHRLGAWLRSVGVALALALPVLVYGLAQHDQISFLAHRKQADLATAMVGQWFGSALSALVAWLLIGSAILWVFRRPRLDPRLDPRLRARPHAPERRTLLVLLTWLIVPSAVLLVGTRLIAPMYSERYLSFCTPAVAIVIAIGIVALRVRWLQVCTLLLLIALMIPTFLAQRTEFAKDGGSDWRQAASVVGAGAKPGEAVVFDESTRPSRRPRLAMRLYPQDFRGLDDVTLAHPFSDTAGLWDTTVPLASVTDRLAATHTVWVLENVGSVESLRGTDVHDLESIGFTEAASTTIQRTTIIEMTR